jgi:anti-sigma-K factor RskA
MRLRRPEPHTLAGAYAMDAVTRADRARFERHLARCQACARELRELREATARLAGAVAVEPPGPLIERVLASAARTPQLPPSPARPAAWRRPWPVGARHAASAGRVRRTLRSRLATSLAVVLLAAAAAAGLAALRAEHGLGADQQRDQQIAAVLNAPDAVMLTARVKAGGTVTVVMSHHDGSLVFTTDRLPRLAGGRCYQLWLMGPRGDRSAGMLPAAHGGMTGPVIASGMAAGDHMGLTVEPEGGSPRPTSRPILMVNLSA